MLEAGRSRIRDPVRMNSFNLPDPFNRTMALGFTQPLTEMSTGEFQGVKRGRRLRLTNLQPSVSRLSRQRGIFNI
jgi:hypothetical protein